MICLRLPKNLSYKYLCCIFRKKIFYKRIRFPAVENRLKNAIHSLIGKWILPETNNSPVWQTLKINFAFPRPVYPPRTIITLSFEQKCSSIFATLPMTTSVNRPRSSRDEGFNGELPLDACAFRRQGRWSTAMGNRFDVICCTFRFKRFCRIVANVREEFDYPWETRKFGVTLAWV